MKRNSRAIGLEANELTMTASRHFVARSPVLTERYFFLSMCVLIFAAVFYGFGSEYIRFRAEYFHFRQ